MANDGMRIIGGKQSFAERQLEAFRKLSKMIVKGKPTVEAGWFDTAKYKAGMKGDGKTPIPKDMVGQPIAKIARVQNYGAVIKLKSGKVIRIPPRPFMQLAIKRFAADGDGARKKIAMALARGKITPQQAMGAIGNELEKAIKEAIKKGDWQKNSAATIEKKGFNAPLIDSSQLWQTVVNKVNT